MPLLPPLVLEVENGPQVPSFHNFTYLDPQVGLIRNLGARHLVSNLAYLDYSYEFKYEDTPIVQI
jgi:hypothetical protein